MAGVEIPKSRIQEDFEFLEWLGKGAFGNVRKMRKKLDCRIYAIKRIKLNPNEKKYIMREVQLLSGMNHKNVVRYYNSWIESATLDDQITPMSSDRTTTTQDKADMVNQLESDEIGKFDDENSDAFVSDSEEHCAFIKSFENIEFESDVKEIQCLYIQMEFCEKSTLRTAIDNDLYEDEERVWRLFREIVEGLAHIHQQGMIHRDLKPVNIFLDSNDHIKIGDFGLARPNISLTLVQTTDADKESQFEKGGSFDVDELGSLTGYVGTPLYVAPELSAKTDKAIEYNEKVDIYSLGIIFFEMTYNKPLATKMERNRILSSLRLKEIIFPPNIIETLSHVRIIRWLLNHDPSQRPTAQELLYSKLMRQLSNSQNFNNNEPEGNDGNKLPQFPIETVQELENFNKLLREDATARAQYEKIIKNIGEEDVKKHVRQALLILSDELSCKLSWTGKKETIRVMDMTFVDIMIDSIKSGRNCTISDVQDIIKKWLQRASDRVRYSRKKEAQT